jgi:hypothetical protein
MIIIKTPNQIDDCKINQTFQKCKKNFAANSTGSIQAGIASNDVPHPLPSPKGEGASLRGTKQSGNG